MSDPCKSCGVLPVLPIGHKKFCQCCGTALDPEQVTCVKCNVPITISPLSPFCTNCGNSVSKRADACPSCGAEPTEHKKFCRQCGTALNPEQVVCVKCNAPIKTSTGGVSVFFLVLGVVVGIGLMSTGNELFGIIILVGAIGKFLMDLVQMVKK